MVIGVFLLVPAFLGTANGVSARASVDKGRPGSPFGEKASSVWTSDVAAPTPPTVALLGIRHLSRIQGQITISVQAGDAAGI